MTYLQFHLVFILPPLLALALIPPRPAAAPGERRPWPWLLLLALLAVLYTTPWDNYLVARGIWSYGAARVLGTIGYVPLEEYLFFILQPLLTGLWFVRLRARPALRRPDAAPGPHARRLGAAFWLLVAVVGAVLLTTEPGTYLGLILAWAAPVLAGQWFLAGDAFLRHRRLFFLAVAVPTLYLWVADAIAIRLGIWHIAEATTLGWRPVGLPVEEATFFLVTNLLVVQGLWLFLPLSQPHAARHA
ncbi:MAG: lycopene beta-cyclase [Rhodothermaceae bacterium]|nr:MAG: lycopene beta-cyclase [Rhodothermaceae bacterium]